MTLNRRALQRWLSRFIGEKQTLHKTVCVALYVFPREIRVALTQRKPDCDRGELWEAWFNLFWRWSSVTVCFFNVRFPVKRERFRFFVLPKRTRHALNPDSNHLAKTWRQQNRTAKPPCLLQRGQDSRSSRGPCIQRWENPTVNNNNNNNNNEL